MNDHFIETSLFSNTTLSNMTCGQNFPLFSEAKTNREDCCLCHAAHQIYGSICMIFGYLSHMLK